MKMLSNLDDQVYKKNSSKTLIWQTSIENYKSKLKRNFFQKRKLNNCGIVLMKRKIMKIYFKVIFNTKIFYIKFVQ